MPVPTFLLPTIILIISITLTNANPTNLNFRQAPKYYNSPNCPIIHPTHNNNICHKNSINVAMTLDATYLRGSLAAVFSILQHSSCPENIFFHFITSSSSTTSHLNDAVLNSFPYLNFQIYPFNDFAASGLISTSIRAALDCPLNYARNYLNVLLPKCIEKIVYLDSDLVLVDDVAKLASTPLPNGAVLAAPEYCNANFTSYFTTTFWANPSLSLTFANRGRLCYFNTGVMVIDLERWRVGDYTTRIEEWMELQKRIRIYELGSLPPFMLVFAGNVAPVDHRWNQHGLGGDNYMGVCRSLHPGPVSLLHWSGKGKPWVRIDSGRACPVDALWAPYDLLRTSYVLDS